MHHHIRGPSMLRRQLEHVWPYHQVSIETGSVANPSSGPSQVGTSENAARAMKLKLQFLEMAHRLFILGVHANRR
jgi:hypothetical protein